MITKKSRNIALAVIGFIFTIGLYNNAEMSRKDGINRTHNILVLAGLGSVLIGVTVTMDTED
tara:strand:+ start:60 stop:245 length:186 start_codon:yes stop_codon:yes gene_type:complete